MGFWSFMRDMFVFDWLFGQRKKKSVWQQPQSDNRQYADHSNHDNRGGGRYSNYSRNDYVQQDFDDDLDSGMFDDF